MTEVTTDLQGGGGSGPLDRGHGGAVDGEGRAAVTRAGDRGITDIAAKVVAALPSLDGRQRRVGRAVYRLLAAGRPATPASVAPMADLGPEEAAAVMAGLPTARRQAGAVTAFLGLQAEPGAHRLRFAGVDCWTWCAWDTLFIPALVGSRALVESTCPVTRTTVVVEVDPVDGVVAAEPAGALLTFLRSPRPYGGDIVDSFCRWMHFVSGPVAGERWVGAAAAERDDVIVLPLAAGVAIGRATNRAVFGVPG